MDENDRLTDSLAQITTQLAVLQLAVAALIDRHPQPEDVEQLLRARLALLHANLASGGSPAHETSLLRETSERFLSQLSWRDPPQPHRT